MSDLRTRFLASELASPLLVSAPDSADSENLERLEAFAGAVVLPSLCAERAEEEELALHVRLEEVAFDSAESGPGFLAFARYETQPDAYLHRLESLKRALSIPLPRLHPEIRLEKLYPSNLILNMHDASCDTCGTALQTSMPDGDRILCEPCYQKAVV